jgi:hypothetical protein
MREPTHRTPCLAHYGTTLAEPKPPEGTDLATWPISGQCLAAHEFMAALGFVPLITNLYPTLGRQWIFRRGERGDVDYLEKDQFSSWIAGDAPSTTSPRVGDTVFRLPLRDLESWRDVLAPFVKEPVWAPGGGTDGNLVMGPDEQWYELTESVELPADNRVISIWTDPADVERIAADYVRCFGMHVVTTDADFHGVGRATVVRRDDPAVTIQLVHSPAVQPRWSSPDGGSPQADIFLQTGYAHFRLGATDADEVRQVAETVFPDTGDVGYVMFHHAYLELIEY